ncbi:MAG: hypothetical protein JHC31_11480 [Sulfurihydrogenibium sp.]|nr:hypothetical protein [Sulfurihydrogenibium sp.]
MEKDLNLPELSFYDFADALGLLEKNIKRVEPTEQNIRQSDLTLVSFSPMVVARYNNKTTTMKDLFPTTTITAFKNVLNSLNTEDWRDLRFTVSLYSNNNQSYQNFEKSKVLARADIDKAFTLEELIKLVENTFEGYLPNILHRTYKGWHLFWVCDEFIDRENRQLIDDFVKFLNRFKYRQKATWIDRLDLFGAMTRIVNSDLKCYLYNPILYSEKTLRNIDVKRAVSKYDYVIPSKEELEDVLSHCSAFQTLDNTWETHNYFQWRDMGFIYAARYLLANSEVEKKRIYNEYVEKSLTHPKANINKIKKQFLQYSINWVPKDNKFKIPSCLLYTFQASVKDALFLEKEMDI